jgi:hypothetical protein
MMEIMSHCTEFWDINQGIKGFGGQPSSFNRIVLKLLGFFEQKKFKKVHLERTLDLMLDFSGIRTHDLTNFV